MALERELETYKRETAEWRAEGPWVNGTWRVSPGVIVAGLNPVTADAVCTAIMGFDPMADGGTALFERCDSTLKLAELHGIGTRDPARATCGASK